MTVYPTAKINLGLNVVAQRPDGYHDIETVFWPVDGFREQVTDELTIEQSVVPGAHLMVTGVSELCPPEKNLVVKAYNLLREDFDLPGVDIHLNKRLPTQAGIGGGSSDGAYMIKALNELFHLGLTVEQMQQYASRLGADCAFFIQKECSYATGIGDKLENLKAMTDIKRFTLMSCKNGIFFNYRYLVLVKPDVAVSTKEAYAGITPHKPVRNCRDTVVNEPVEKWRDLLHNDFEDSIFPKLPLLKEIKEQLYKDGAVYASMSGSGSTIYGIFNHKTDITKYAKYYHKIVTF